MVEGVTGPVAAGQRVPYDALPAHLLAWVDGTLSSPVVASSTQVGGFSPGAAARLRCADGTRAFVKAVSAEANPDTPGLHRREIDVLSVLPAGLPAPRLIAAYDEDPWVALLVDDIDGTHPTLPWRDDELGRMLAATKLVSEHTDVAVRPAREHVVRWKGWQNLSANADAVRDDWVRDNIEDLVALEHEAVEAVAGDHLIHLDVRADNVLLSPDRTWLVDWPWAAIGPRWFDIVVSAPAVTMHGGPDPEEYLRRSGLCTAADADAVTAAVAAFCGMLTWLASLPPPPGLPAIREFQAAQGTVALRWLRPRTGWR